MGRQLFGKAGADDTNVGKRAMSGGIQDLESRVTSLIERYRESRQRVAELEGRIGGLERENEELRTALAANEAQVSERDSLEEEVRVRLDRIINQIDSLESELSQIESSDDD